MISNLPNEWRSSAVFKAIPLDTFIASIDVDPDLEKALDLYFFLLKDNLNSIYEAAH